LLLLLLLLLLLILFNQKHNLLRHSYQSVRFCEAAVSGEDGKGSTARNIYHIEPTKLLDIHSREVLLNTYNTLIMEEFERKYGYWIQDRNPKGKTR
jgi:hypothetical protein